jgi:hypothetical protein
MGETCEGGSKPVAVLIDNFLLILKSWSGQGEFRVFSVQLFTSNAASMGLFRLPGLLIAKVIFLPVDKATRVAYFCGSFCPYKEFFAGGALRKGGIKWLQ